MGSNASIDVPAVRNMMGGGAAEHADRDDTNAGSPRERWLQWIDAPDNAENGATDFDVVPSDTPGLRIVRMGGIWWTMPLRIFLSLLWIKRYELILELHLAKQIRRRQRKARLAWKRLRRTMRPRWRRYSELLCLRKEMRRRQPWYLQ